MAAVRSRQWESLTDDFSEVMDLALSRMRWGAIEVSQFEAEISQLMTAEITEQIGEELAVIGCGARSAHVTSPTILENIQREAHTAAVSIVDTYNRDLAYAIQAIRTETETANRNTFIKRLSEWADAREQWKNDQISQMAIIGAKSYAVREFVRQNKVTAQAYVGGPRPAAEEECQALIDGEPYDADKLPAEFPIHINCPHYWDIREAQTALDCEEVWAGE